MYKGGNKAISLIAALKHLLFLLQMLLLSVSNQSFGVTTVSTCVEGLYMFFINFESKHLWICVTLVLIEIEDEVDVWFNV